MVTLMELPAELRIRIWEFALPSYETYVLKQQVTTPALCRASRDICNESLSIWRGANAFRLLTRLTKRNCATDPDPTGCFSAHHDRGSTHIPRFEWIQSWIVPAAYLKAKVPADSWDELAGVRLVANVIVNKCSCIVQLSIPIFIGPTKEFANDGAVKLARLKARNMIRNLEVFLGRHLVQDDEKVAKMDKIDIAEWRWEQDNMSVWMEDLWKTDLI